MHRITALVMACAVVMKGEIGQPFMTRGDKVYHNFGELHSACAKGVVCVFLFYAKMPLKVY